VLGVALATSRRRLKTGGQQTLPKKEGSVVRGTLKDWKSMQGIQGLERAFEYLAKADLAALPLGRTDIEGDDVYVMMSEGETKRPSR